ncbi:MAG: ABC transporter permease subunit [Candidatus Brocadiia bacterium]
MNGFRTLMRKELREMVRTRRLLVAVVLFFFVGAASPATAKLLPKLLAMLGSSPDSGVKITLLADPSVKDALVQYVKNFGMLPILAVLMAMGSVSGEFDRKTAPLLLSRPVGRGAFILAKFCAPALVYTFLTAFSAVIFYIYAAVLFEAVPLADFANLNAFLLLALLTFLAGTVGAGAISVSTGISAAAGIGLYIAFAMTAMWVSAAVYTPAGLSINAGRIIRGAELVKPVISCVSAIAFAWVFLWAGIAAFRRREI